MYYKVKLIKTNLQKFPSPHTAPYIVLYSYMRMCIVQCREPKKGQQKVRIFKKTGFVPLEVATLPYTTLGYMAHVQCREPKKVSERS